MKKGLVLGLLAGAAATAAAVIYLKKKNECCCYDDDFDADLECDSCCGDCCDCEDDCDCDCTDIPAEKAEESVITPDACAACGCSEEEALDSIVEPVESDEV